MHALVNGWGVAGRTGCRGGEGGGVGGGGGTEGSFTSPSNLIPPINHTLHTPILAWIHEFMSFIFCIHLQNFATERANCLKDSNKQY